MPHAARNILGRLVFVSMVLLALAGAMLPAPAQAETCAPAGEAEAVAFSIASDPCPADECADCAVVCAHGCCHAPAVGVLGAAILSLELPRFEVPAGWADTVGVPLGDQAGLLRPPRP